MWDKDHHRGDHPQFEREGGGGEEEDGSGHFQEEGRLLLESQSEIYCVCFFIICIYVMYILKFSFLIFRLFVRFVEGNLSSVLL